jgi:putative two-component system response regulator
MSAGDRLIMIVDDRVDIVNVLTLTLRNHGYRTVGFTDAAAALAALDAEPPDLIMVDINMPIMDGYEVCAQIKSRPRFHDTPVVFMSGMDDATVKVRAFSQGGVDYLTKPFRREEVLARLATHLRLSQMQAELARRNEDLQQIVEKQVREIADGHLATIYALARLAECKDGVMARHLERVQLYTRALATRLGRQPDLQVQLTPAYIDNLQRASPLHDIGKVGTPDSVLLKPDRLTEAEMAIMRQHTVLGATTLGEVSAKYPGNSLLSMGTRIARSHHEKWDGSGYPDGMRGREIPLCARIMALADAYDAIRSKRQYKPAMSHEEAVRRILLDSGRHFDPQVVTAFQDVAAEFDAVAEGLSDDAVNAV